MSEQGRLRLTNRRLERLPHRVIPAEIERSEMRAGTHSVTSPNYLTNPSTTALTAFL